MTETLKIALAQLNLLVGDVRGNVTKVVASARRAHSELGADLVLYPELALSGYPPEDLLFHRGFRRQIEAGLAQLRAELGEAAVLVGFPEYAGAGIYNAAALIARGEIAAIHRKAELPNYKVFDEKRYFQAGSQPTVVNSRDFKTGLLVCEDIWEPPAAQLARADGAQLLVVINASPYEIHKQREREEIARARVREVRLPLAYVNLVGGQDELVFDGNSFVMDAEGQVVMRAPPFEEGTWVVEFTRDARGRVVPVPGRVAAELSDEESVYGALVLGVRDYVEKHGFPGVVMGLSGGVDSALTLAIAVDALGKDRVQAVMMPSRYTSSMSLEDRIQHLIGWQRSAILLSGPQLRRGLPLDHARGDHPLERIAVARQAIHEQLAAVLDRRKTAGHVAIERGIADRHLALVAGREQHAPCLVRQGHEQQHAAARLDVLLGGVRRPAGKFVLERRQRRLEHSFDREHAVLHAE